jgi:lipopolysaccharide transport system ATP-binding protein
MSDIVIKVENLSKLYRLGTVGTTTLKEDLQSFWNRIFTGKEVQAETNDRSVKGSSEYVWALKDVNFEVKQGEVLGIIGKNGAGKSTLLKLLSKVTAPTQGSIKVKGRIASLLEVGTGFHPELTGRNNIYLNGHILGMTKQEIDSKFDEIVAFSGVERYIDTPVKRYSSGMYVRLAFAVAAHLEPEILIIDEVLAVGDAEFQKKCLGKMQDVSRNDGRTVLFVSHNMGAVQDLCSKGLLMQRGTVETSGSISSVIASYLNIFKSTNFKTELAKRSDREGNRNCTFTSYTLLDEVGIEVERFLSGQNGAIALHFTVNFPQNVHTLHFSIRVSDDTDNTIFHMSNSVANGKEFQLSADIKNGTVICRFSQLPLQPGIYYLHFFCSDLQNIFDHVHFAGSIEVEAGKFFLSNKLPPAGVVLVKNVWELKSSPI